jgi:hypothetical protein
MRAADRTPSPTRHPTTARPAPVIEAPVFGSFYRAAPRRRRDERPSGRHKHTPARPSRRRRRKATSANIRGVRRGRASARAPAAEAAPWGVPPRELACAGCGRATPQLTIGGSVWMGTACGGRLRGRGNDLQARLQPPAPFPVGPAPTHDHDATQYGVRPYQTPVHRPHPRGFAPTGVAVTWQYTWLSASPGRLQPGGPRVY